ncbi:MAG: glycosyltransferase family 4 protein [Kiritimatiellia bacterium]
MKIALLCPRYLWAGGGSVLYTRRLAEEWARTGHEVTVFADRPAPPGDPGQEQTRGCATRLLERDLDAENAARRRLSIETRRGGYRLARLLYGGGSTRLVSYGPVCPELENPATFSGFDALVLVNSSTAWTVQLARVLPRLRDVRTLAVPLFHPHEETAAFPDHRKLHRGYGAIGTLTDFEKDWLAGRGWDPARIHTLWAGSDPVEQPPDPAGFRARHGIPPDAPVVLFVGRKIFNKGVTHVVQAMDLVWRDHPEAWLVLAGFRHNPPEWLRGYLAATALGTRQCVNLDDVPAAERDSAMAACRVMAAPSVSDSFGIVYLDAWRLGRPVIACLDTCCESFITPGVNGWLVPFGDVPALAASIRDALDRPGRAADLGRAGREAWRTRFQWPRVAAHAAAVLAALPGAPA